MEEQRFVVPQDEFKKYSQIAANYKRAVSDNSDRLRFLYNLKTQTPLSEPTEEHMQWVRSEQRKEINSHNHAIARRILAEKAELAELKRQKEENTQKLQKLYDLEVAMFDWAWKVAVKAKENNGQVRKEEWFFALTIWDFLENSRTDNDLVRRLSSNVEFSCNLLADAKRLDIGPLESIEHHCEAIQEMSRQIMRDKKFLTPIRDRTVKFSYDFMDTAMRASHSRAKSAAWIKQNLQSDSEGNFTRKKLVLLYALYMGINHVESQLSMELENKLMHALGRSDLMDKHQEHRGRARRLSFERKKRDFIAQELGEALKVMLSTPTKNGNTLTFTPDTNITEASLEVLIGLAGCVSKLETSYSYKKNSVYIENTLDVLEQAYDYMYQNKGTVKGVSAVAEDKEVELPGSVRKLLQDKDPTYLPPHYRSRA